MKERAAAAKQAAAELKETLKRSLVGHGWSQAQLKTKIEVQGGALSKGAISEALNPERPPPSLPTLNTIAAGLGIAGRELEDLRRLHGRAVRRTDDWTPYLHAAHCAAQGHPYPGLELRATVATPSSVYLDQQAQLQASSIEIAGNDEPDRVSGEQLLTEGRSCVVVAGPGGGKSSLLRRALTASVERWLGGPGDRVMPVLVSAAALSIETPFADAVADAVNAALSPFGLPARIPSDAFRSPPVSGVPWLVLVDGFDEVTDQQVRHRLLTTLSKVVPREDDPDPTCLIVLASRPLPDEEFTALGAVSRYELCPFEERDLGPFAEQWLDALGLERPPGSGAAFAAALDQAFLTELARTPLLAAMLCQLYAAAPDSPLPTGRSSIYRAFLEMLRERQYERGKTGVVAQTEASLARYGPRVVSWAHGVLDRLPTLAAHVAAAQLEHDDTPATELMAAHPGAACPEQVPPEIWDSFLAASLRRSGVMVVDGGELRFLHRTVLEYLAARNVAPGRTMDAAERFFARHRGGRPWPWPRRWLPPARENDSYVGFLLDYWLEQDPDRTDRALYRLATRDGIEGSEFLVRQRALGTNIPRRCTQGAVRTLYALSQRKPSMRDEVTIRAATALAESGDERGLDALADIAGGDRFLGMVRLRAAQSLAFLGDARGADLLVALVSPTPGNTEAERIMGTCLYDHPAQAQLEFLVGGMSLLDSGRLEAAATLAHVDDPRVPDVLVELATRPTPNPHSRHRLRAARMLANRGDPRGLPIMVDLAGDRALSGDLRVATAVALLDADHEFALTTLTALAQEPELDDGARVQAARQLARWEERGRDLLASLAGDHHITDVERARAAFLLRRLNDERGRTMLALIAESRQVERSVRSWARERL